MSGAGTSPAGCYPAGFGTPTAAPLPGGGVFLDANGIQQTGRAIDLRTGRYTYDAYGNSVGVATVRQLVQVAVKTLFNSSAVQGLGIRLSDLKDITSNYDKQLDVVVRDALADLVARKLVAVVDVTAQRFGAPGVQTGVYGHVRFRDLTTGLEDSLPLTT